MALALNWAPVAAQELQQTASVEGITEHVLDNGLRVLIFPDASKPTTTVNITYFVGSRHEAYGETGMAHLLEHLVFKGTPDHPDIPQELTERGARPNGTTWVDRTNYFETFPATEDNLDWALDLESDRMVNSFISKDDLESEMTVVRSEMEAGENNPFGMLMDRTLSTMYLWHNYGKSTIGARSDVENVPIERLQAFYRKYYQPDNAMLVIAGKFDEAKALELVVEKFGAIPRPDRSGANYLYPTYTREPTQDGERSITLRRVGDVQLVMASFHVPPGSHEEELTLYGLIRRGDEIWQYVDEGGAHGGDAERVYYRYRQRLDGFVSLDAGARTGTALTLPLRFQGDRLSLNIKATGSAKVAVTDENGEAIPGFDFHDCDEIKGDFVDKAVTWRSGKDLKVLKGKAVRLKFQLRDAKLYAFELRD